MIGLAVLQGSNVCLFDINGEIESVKVTMTLVGEGVKVRRKDLDLDLVTAGL